MELVLKSRGKEEPEAEVDERNQMRMYSFKQLFNLINAVANQSEVSDRILANENNIKDIYTKLEEQARTNQ